MVTDQCLGSSEEGLCSPQRSAHTLPSLLWYQLPWTRSREPDHPGTRGRCSGAWGCSHQLLSSGETLSVLPTSLSPPLSPLSWWR